MTVNAWCGRCGESFALTELSAPSGDLPVGACPRCGVMLAPDYATVLVSAVRQLLGAADAFAAAAGQLGDIAPALHLDRRALAAELESILDH